MEPTMSMYATRKDWREAMDKWIAANPVTMDGVQYQCSERESEPARSTFGWWKARQLSGFPLGQCVYLSDSQIQNGTIAA